MAKVLTSAVFFDGFTTTPRLSHPEGIAVHSDGSVWCGSEDGKIFRVSPDGQSHAVVADLEGFTLGIAFDNAHNLYVCHLDKSNVFRLEAKDGVATPLFSEGEGPSVPNFPVVDPLRKRLLVSDSQRLPHNHPSIWEVGLDGSSAKPWLEVPIDFANGMALSRDAKTLFVAASWEHAVYRVSIDDEGNAGEIEKFIDNIPGIPDGLAVTVDDRLVIGCYEPSVVLLVDNGHLTELLRDETAHLMCHPTNIAFRGSDLFTANLGRWHLTKIDTTLHGPASSLPADMVDPHGG
jgi:gluconolactonase